MGTLNRTHREYKLMKQNNNYDPLDIIEYEKSNENKGIDSTTHMWIYGLVDPINNELFYIGKTYNTKKRLGWHIGHADKEARQPLLSERVSSILDYHKVPIIINIALCSPYTAPSIESACIIIAYDLGVKLLNSVKTRSRYMTVCDEWRKMIEDKITEIINGLQDSNYINILQGSHTEERNTEKDTFNKGFHGDYRLTNRMLHIMMQIDSGILKQKDIALSLNIAYGAMSISASWLLKMKYITREKIGRCWHLSLTSSGQQRLYDERTKITETINGLPYAERKRIAQKLLNDTT